MRFCLPKNSHEIEVRGAPLGSLPQLYEQLRVADTEFKIEQASIAQENLPQT